MKNYYTLQQGSMEDEFQNPENTFTIHNFGNNELNTLKHVPKSFSEDSPFVIFERVSPSHGAVVKSYEAPESSTDVKYELTLNYMRSGHHGHEEGIRISILDAKGNLLVSGGLSDEFKFSVDSKTNFSIRVEFSGSIDKMADLVIQGKGIITQEIVDNKYNE